MSRSRHDPAFIAAKIAERQAAETARISGMADFIAEQVRYENDADYRAAQDADRAQRQAAVYASMDAEAARYRAAREMAA